MGFEQLQVPIEDLLRSDSTGNIRELIEASHPAELAEIMIRLDSEARKVFFSLIENIELKAKTIVELPPEVYRSLLENMEYAQAISLIERMDNDDAADILGHLPKEVAHELLNLLGRTTDPAESSNLAELLRHPPDTAGGVMNSEVFKLDENLTLLEAAKVIQTVPEDQSIHYIYIVNRDNILTGTISWKQLLRGKPQSLLRDVMNKDTVSVRVDMDQEEVAKIVQRYNLVAVPVVDSRNHLVGVITVDDVIDVIQEEATEDILAIGGVHDGDLLNKSIVTNSRARIPWLLVTCLGGLVASKVISGYSDYLSQVVLLSAFIPVVLGMAGNVGTQTATIMIRGLALNQIGVQSMGKAIFKEARVGLLLGLVYSVLIGGIVSYGSQTLTRVGIIVGSAVLSNIVLASLLGAVIPLGLHRFKVDPALAAGPFVTTIIDIVGMLVYCNFIYLFLK